MFYELESEDASTVNLKPGFNNTMEEVLLSAIVNRGTDNVFGNQGDGSGNNNNIERIDFIFDDGIIVSGTPSNEGFIILERGGNDAFKITPITGLDVNGNPVAFGDVVSIGTGDWGSSGSSIITTVMSSPTPGDLLEKTTTVGSQPISGVAITYAELGLTENELFYGFSLAGGDVTTDGANWADVTNTGFFPSNTSSTSGAEGGLDLLAGGSFYSTNLVEDSYTLTGDECWRMLSSPVPTTYRNLLNGLWTQGTDGADYAGGAPNVLVWPTAQDGTDPTNWVTPNSLNDPIPAGTGVLVSVYSDDDFDGTEDGFPKTVNISGTGYTGEVSPDLNINDSGWTLVGNPYNFPIDFSSGSLTKTNINDVAYIYDRNLTGSSEGDGTNGNTGGWRTTSGGVVGDIFNGIIEPFQGFFIQNDGSGSVFTFSESAEDVSGNGQFYGKKKEAPENVIRFEMNGEGLLNSTWITISEKGSHERTNSDAFELLPFSDDYLLLGSRKSDAMFDIAHFPVMEEGEITLATETTKAGSYTIAATDFEVTPGVELLFIDTETNVRIPVDDNFSYSFEITETIPKAEKFVGSSLACGTVEQAQGQFMPTVAKVNKNKPGRFIIKVTGSESAGNQTIPDSFNLQQNYPNPFNPTTQITYELPHQADVRLEVFDMNGRQVATLVSQNVSAGIHTVNFNATNLSSGVYMYRLQAGATVFTRKLTLIK